MAIFNSYVKLPEGIFSIFKAKFTCLMHNMFHEWWIMIIYGLSLSVSTSINVKGSFLLVRSVPVEGLQISVGTAGPQLRVQDVT